MARCLMLLWAIGLSSCSLVLDPTHYDLCETPQPPRCDGDRLVVCRGELAEHTSCTEGCDPIAGACIAPLCGNGAIDQGEVCDDENHQSGDGCRGDCAKTESCGDGTFDLGESCDDGNTADGDGCDCRAPDILVNTTVRDQQERPAIAILPDGTALIVWDDNSRMEPDTSGGAIRGRLVHGDVPVGEDQVLNEQLAFEQTISHVAASPEGDGFLVVWSDGSGVTPDTSGTAIRGRMFDPALTPMDGDFVVNSTVAGDQGEPGIVALPGGGYLVAWEDRSEEAPDDTSGSGLRARRLDSSGAPVGDEVAVNTTTDGDQVHIAMAACPDGTVLAVWEDQSLSASDPSGSAIRGRRMADDGLFIDASDFPINTTTARDQESPAVVCTPSGDFLVAWTDGSPAAGLGDVRARRIPADGDPIDDDYIVNSTQTGDQEFPSLLALPDRIVVAFEDQSGLEPDTSDNGVRVRWLGAAGEPGISEDFVVNSLIELDQGEPVMAARADSSVIVVWEDESFTPPDDQADAIRMKILTPPP